MKAFGRLSILFNVILVTLILFLVGASLAVWYFERESSSDAVTVIEIPQGAGLNQVALLLEERDLIDSQLFFRMAAYYQGNQQNMKFGEYEIPAGASMSEIQDILTDGRAIQLLVTIPEGWSSYQIVKRLRDVPELVGDVEEIPAEGVLAPNTYSFIRGEKRQEVLDRMMRAQDTILNEAWENRVDNLPIDSKEELLILASLIEKETGTPDERPMVASVFVNRLRKGMKLQTDPTVIYGLTLGRESLGRGIRRSELARETPYNTYIIAGLPPTPIANPGAASIQAAANPGQTDFIYFVAKTKGKPGDGHLFAQTLDEHNANVAKYRAQAEPGE